MGGNGGRVAPPGARRPPQQIDTCHRLTMLELLDAHVTFTSVGAPGKLQRGLVVCPRCNHRRAALYTRPGVPGIGCRGRDCLNLAYATQTTLKTRSTACSLERIAELVRRAKTAKHKRTREKWKAKALAAAAEYSKRGLARTKRREAILDTWSHERVQQIAKDSDGAKPE